MVLMGDRPPEEGHDPIAHHLVHSAFVAVNGCYHALHHCIKDLPRLFRVAVGQQFQRRFQVGKKHRDLLTLPFEGTPGGEDHLGEVRRCVYLGRVGTRGEGWGGRGRRLSGEGRAAVIAKSCSGPSQASTGVAGVRQCAVTRLTTACLLAILMPALWAVHVTSSWMPVSAVRTPAQRQGAYVFPRAPRAK